MQRVPDQEIYTKALTKLRLQGMRAMDPFNGCTYRGPDPDHPGQPVFCAVGYLLLPKDLDQLEADGALSYPVTSQSLGDALRQALGLDFDMSEEDLSEVNQRTRDLLVDLQDAHDTRLPTKRGLDCSEWECQMQRIAVKYGFEYPAP